MPSLTFVTPASPGRSIVRTALLLASLREFGGSLAENPVWVFYPQDLGAFSGKERSSLQELGAKLVPFQADNKLLKFPLGYKVRAAAVAEALASGETDFLVWLDPDTLILSPPRDFILPEGKSLAYRPVHHQLLGTSWGDEQDEFWQLVYQYTRAAPERDFQMLTHTGEMIRPYFNAGSYAVRPERGILGNWWENFQNCYQTPVFKRYYDQEALFAVFMHQAVLTGTILAVLEQSELQALSPSINYPLHLHEEIPEEQRSKRIDELVTVRYENIFDHDGWQEALPFSKELAGWITSRLNEYHHGGDQA